MDRRFFIVVDRSWASSSESLRKRLAKKFLHPVGSVVGHLEPRCSLLLKLRTTDGVLTDHNASLEELSGQYFIKSVPLADHPQGEGSGGRYLAFFFEGTETQARCIVQQWESGLFEEVEAEDPTLRLFAYALPPSSTTCVDAEALVSVLYHRAASADPDLYAAHATRFLSSPHVLRSLFNHVLQLRSADNINFEIKLKSIGEQLRVFLADPGSSIRIEAMERSHQELWSDVYGDRIAFLDGGVARIPSLAGLEPMAFRVGVYDVRPGEPDPERRENFCMFPFVLGDLLDPVRGMELQTDRKRLQEAVRYVVEPLTALEYLRGTSDVRMLFVHGPLINQYLTYNEDHPNYLPSLDSSFLLEYGVSRQEVEAQVEHIPRDKTGPLWNQFMAVYAFLMQRLHNISTPVSGVVERVAGRSVAKAVLQSLVDDRVIDLRYVKRIEEEMDRYQVTDDFLFGCVLRAGEFLTPVPVSKNPIRRAVDRWQPVVKQYPSPSATMLKTEETNFPFRIEMNLAAVEQYRLIARVLYHTARLLPRYAFPVGLDIADKYAKIPDWISKGVSAEIAATILRRALRTGDAVLVTQVRKFLARSPRDFFFRPTHND